MADAPGQLTAAIRLTRLTTAYDRREDRLLLSGETEAGGVESFLLTRRLSLRLLEHLLGLLDSGQSRQDKPKASTQTETLMQEMAQSRAQSRLQPQDPVAPSAGTEPWLVEKVDVGRLRNGVRLVLDDGAGRRVETRLNGEELRQWPGIVYRLWRKAGWGDEVWPQWMRESQAPAAHRGKAVH